MNSIEKLGPIPLYVQIQHWIKEQLKIGTWKPKEKIPSEADLALTLEVSRGTIKRAINHLIAEGVLIQIHGKGTFVVGAQMEQPLAERLVSIAEVLAENKQDFITRFLGIQIVKAREIGRHLNISEMESIFFLQRLRFMDDLPVVYLENFLPVRLFPGLEKFDFTKLSLFAIIEQEYGIKIAWGKRSFMAKGADEHQASLLEIERGTPITFLEQEIYAENDVACEYSNVWIRNDRIKLTSILKR